MQLRLDGRAALITGGSKGLGLAIAKAFAGAGGQVAMVARNAEQLGKAEAKIKAAAPEAKVTAIPVTAFYASNDAPSHYARFAFCKGEAVLDAALERMGEWLAARGGGGADRAVAPRLAAG